MKPFVHLHLHTEYSLLDGCARISKLLDIVSERGYPAVAMTDHGNMYGTMQFYKGCLERHIKPIIGTEFYICNDLYKKTGKDDIGHIVLLAKNNTGYKNLLKLNSIAFVDGFYYKPRIDYKLLEQYSEGLICLSACLAGHIPQLILQARYEEADALALKLKNMFADGDFYLEIQNHGLKEQIEVLSHLADMSNRLQIKLVATNDVHYLNKEDAEMQDVLMCVQMGKTVDDPDRMKFSTDEFYFKTYEEMLEALPNFQDALDTTLEIADKCDVVIRSKAHGDIKGIDEKYILPATENFIPEYHAPNGMDNFEFLKSMTYEGLKKKYKKVTPELLERAETELSIIHDLGFVEYFLVVWDYINYARQAGIPVGPGRGSGAGSIVAYAISITLVDPIKYDLLFERFIHKERVSMPDFDVDFDFDHRADVIEYVKRKYSPSHVAQIITFGTMAAKNAIRDVARVLKVPYSEADKISKLIPAKPLEGIKKPPVLKYYFGTTGKEENNKFIIPELRAIYDGDEQIKHVIDLAIKLEGMPRNTSTHACGVLIAPDDVQNFVPLSRNGEDISTQYTMTELESLGLLKMDFLGLKTLTDIRKALEYVKEQTGEEIDFYSMDYDDPKVYELISSGNTEAIFQLESGGFKKFLKELKPDCLEDIIAGVSLYRPGPMDSIPRYIKNKHNPSQIEYADPCLEPILKATYGCIVYQEQVMKVFQVMGGFNMGQADNVRRIMGKKKVDKMPYEKQKFIYGLEDPTGKKSIPGAIKLGISKEVAEQVFSEMESFAQYAFNKSHAAAYAYLTYQTAYLKTYHEVELICAVLNNRITNSDEVKNYIAYAKSENIKVLPPDINKSGTYFKVEDGNLRYGLSALKNVGINVINSIIEERNKNGPFKDFLDFMKRVDASAHNKKCLEGLIISGAFDSFKVNRSQLMAVYELVVDRIARDRKNQTTGQFSLFETIEGDEFDKIDYPDIKEYNKETMLKFEKEIIGAYISGHPLDDYMDKYKEFNLTSNMLLYEENENSEMEEDYSVENENENQISDGAQVSCGGIVIEIKKLTTKNGNKEMAIIKVEDLYGTFDAMFFPNVWARLKNKIKEEDLITIYGKASLRDTENGIVLVENIKHWSKDEETTTNKKVLYLRFDTTDEGLLNLVERCLKTYPGNDDVMIKCISKNQAFKHSLKVSATNYLCNELSGIIGEENIVIKEKETK